MLAGEDSATLEETVSIATSTGDFTAIVLLAQRYDEKRPIAQAKDHATESAQKLQWVLGGNHAADPNEPPMHATSGVAVALLNFGATVP